MLDWIDRFLHSIESLIPNPVKDAIQWTVSAIASVFGSITGNVSDAWHDFTGFLAALAESARMLATSVYDGFADLFTFWIPKVAYPAFWWVTHPDEFASVLLWHLIKWLEHYAWTAAKYLGDFILALVVHHVRPLVHLFEDVLTSIL